MTSPLASLSGFPRRNARLRKRLGGTAARVRNRYTFWQHKVSGWQPPNGQIRWMFIATFPNGGSTALAKLLSTASASTRLTPNGEGQWLVEQLKGKGRWTSQLPVDWAMVRALWLQELRANASFPCLVIEKSPPAMFRMKPLRETFSDMPNSLIVYSRDPYAVCASWAHRYHAKRLTGSAEDRLALFTELGERYARFANQLATLREDADYTFSYEELAADTKGVLTRLKEIEPWLEDVDMDAKLQVKDYEPQPLKNMNATQITKLPDDDIAAITRGLAPAEETIAAFGYELRS